MGLIITFLFQVAIEVNKKNIFFFRPVKQKLAVCVFMGSNFIFYFFLCLIDIHA